MKMKMKIKKSHVSLVLLVLIVSLSVVGALNQSYKPQIKSETPKTSTGEITIITPENKTYTEPDGGYYPGTYGFENDLPGSEPIGWRVRQPDGSGFIAVDAIHAGHRNVLELRKTGGTDKASTGVTFPDNSTAGTFEYWLYKDTDSGIDPTRMSSSGPGGSLQFGIQSGDLYRGPWSSRVTIASNAFTKDEWHHIRVEFNVAIGWQIQIDDTWYGSGYSLPFEDTPTNLTGFGFSSIFSGDHSNYGAYLDALDYSWHEEYTIGDNLNEGLLLSYENTTTLDWQGYSLDGQINKTILGDATIPMPADGLHKVQVFGNDSIGTMYESNLRFFSVNNTPYISISTPENRSYTESDSGYYPATYGFENDLDGSIPQSWIDNSQSGCTARVVSEKTGHKKVVHLDDNSGNKIYFDHYFPAQTHGTIELWVLAADATNGFSVRTFGPADHMVYFAIGGPGDKWRYVDNTGTAINVPTYDGVYDPIDNRWYHLTIHFRCNNSPNFMGLSENSYKAIVDGLESIELEAAFGNVMNSVDRFDITTTAATTTDGWVDAIGFSWDQGYINGDNRNEGLLLSYDKTTTLDWQGYSLDGQLNRTVLGNTTIPMPVDGLHNIQVFGNDSEGTMYESNMRYFTTNALGPDITINSPISNQLYGTTPPDFSLSIPDSDLDSRWYSLDGGTTNIPFSGLTGTIDQTEWDKIGNGTVTITFYANDTINNIDQAEVTIRKDILAPLITVNSPIDNQVFGEGAPSFDLTILEQEIDATWYTLDYGSVNITFSGSAGVIDQTEWAKKGGGSVPIRFYANDSVGNVDFSEVIVVKDLISPMISINAPNNNELFGSAPPNFDITVTESNPDLMWYTLDSGATNVTFGSSTWTIDQTEWNKQGNGTVTIKFYAEDEAGNEGFEEIIVRKDVNIPLITINSPITDDIAGLLPPVYDISVVEPNIDAMWYTLDSGATNVTFSSLTGTIDQTEWDKFGDGAVIIRFSIRDKAGNEAFTEVQVNKDLIAPVITIIAPLIGTVFEDISPIYSISIDESNLDFFWYSLDGGNTNITITAFSGTISESVWNLLPRGHVNLTFYAKDEAGNIGQNSVLISKNTTEEPPPTPPGIPGYNLIALLGITLVVTLILAKRRLKK